MRMFLVVATILAIASSGCSSAASTAPSALPSAAVTTVCDRAQFVPSPTLTCAPALAAAAAALPAGHPPIARQEFRRGGLCPPGAPCVPPRGDQGIVIFDLASGPPLVLYVTAGASGAAAVGTPLPYPSG